VGSDLLITNLVLSHFLIGFVELDICLMETISRFEHYSMDVEMIEGSREGSLLFSEVLGSDAGTGGNLMDFDQKEPTSLGSSFQANSIKLPPIGALHVEAVATLLSTFVPSSENENHTVQEMVQDTSLYGLHAIAVEAAQSPLFRAAFKRAFKAGGMQFVRRQLALRGTYDHAVEYAVKPTNKKKHIEQLARTQGKYHAFCTYSSTLGLKYFYSTPGCKVWDAEHLRDHIIEKLTESLAAGPAPRNRKRARTVSTANEEPVVETGPVSGEKAVAGDRYTDMDVDHCKRPANYCI
jgi:hypothetical protein